MEKAEALNAEGEFAVIRHHEGDKQYTPRDVRTGKLGNLHHLVPLTLLPIGATLAAACSVVKGKEIDPYEGKVNAPADEDAPKSAKGKGGKGGKKKGGGKSGKADPHPDVKIAEAGGSWRNVTHTNGATQKVNGDAAATALAVEWQAKAPEAPTEKKVEGATEKKVEGATEKKVEGATEKKEA